jgi:hypothetical protein
MDGGGDANSPCEITTVAQLQSIKDGLGLHYQLQNDLDLAAIDNWEPIGVSFAPFSGQFNGQGFIISNLTINRSDGNQIGLFGQTSKDAVIKNVRLEEVDINGDSSVGGLVGFNEGDVSASYVTGKVMGSSSVGGLVGQNKVGSVSTSYATVNVEGSSSSVGGLVGINYSDVSTSYATGHVEGGSSVGGLVGRNEAGSVSTSYATGKVTGSSSVGGLVGTNFGTVTSSFWDVETSGLGTANSPDDSAGGTGKTTADMTSFATFVTAWNSPTETVIVDGWQAPNNPSWGICELTNDGYPFLLWQFDSNPCLPDAPTAVTAVRGDGQATVSWTAPIGSGLTYTVTAMPGGLTCTTTGTSCVIEGLTNGTEYTFTVVANNTSGAGPTSALSVGVTPVGPPSAPLDIQVTASINRLQVSWTAPLNNGGMPIVRYIARANPSCEVPALPNEIPGETLYSCELINLDPEQTYQVFVSAVTGAGETEATALGGGSDNTPASFAPNPIIVVPVNSPWALLVLVLMMLCLVAVLNRRRPDWLARSQSNTRPGL